MRATASLRDAKRRQTRERLEQTALRLFAARGFDEVTVEDVCREAQVAPATFYRHFGSKEEVVFDYVAGFGTALQAAVASARGETAPSRQLLRVLVHFAGHLQSQLPSLTLRDGIVLGHDGLMRRTLAVQRDVETGLAQGLAELRGLPAPDDDVVAEAALGLVVLRLAVRSWRGGHTDHLPTATEAAYARVRRLLEVDGSRPCAPPPPEHPPVTPAPGSRPPAGHG
ncbi:transcriptional regulator, TetR family [Geodermatophilus saharensis]|uniref:Transcriptional regulator, TetR family n=1 Tax=Geodermatophilus saharensis TaxID=1137994 RepID=A0A239CYW7_9ACTN|nr:TetR/AcrR family transcriptional regulator [Geodermatophilus saharensis]SNS25119.1 transcriptional regulator, TetR family [Geodermatophilus saharensis]